MKLNLHSYTNVRHMCKIWSKRKHLKFTQWWYMIMATSTFVETARWQKTFIKPWNRSYKRMAKWRTKKLRHICYHW